MPDTSNFQRFKPHDIALSFPETSPSLLPGAPFMRSHLAHERAATNAIGHPQLHHLTSNQRQRRGLITA